LIVSTRKMALLVSAVVTGWATDGATAAGLCETVAIGVLLDVISGARRADDAVMIPGVDSGRA
jgi:hypothetical protein